MGWSFRKSKSFGPFRLNFSSSGIGMSLGVKGVRIGVNKRGTYVSLGANGLYYRQQLNNKSSAYTSSGVNASFNRLQDQADDEAMNKLTDTGSQSFVKELESKSNKVSLLKIFLWTAGIGYVFFLIYIRQPIIIGEKYKDFFFVSKPSVHIRQQPAIHSASLQLVHEHAKLEIIDSASTGWLKVKYQSNPDKEGFIRADMGVMVNKHISTEYRRRMDLQPAWKTAAVLLAILIIAGGIFCYRLDKQRMSMVLNYTMDGELKTLHENFLQYFKEFAASSKVWQQVAAREVSDHRRHGGASVTVSRNLIRALSNHQLPSPHLVTNVSVPFLQLHDRQIYFFPERIIFKKGRQMGAVFYKHINISYSNSRFIEQETPSFDASIVDHTWEYLNKNGDPDRRFSSNRRLPICLYSEYTITSNQGWNEVFITSKQGAMNHFADFIKVIGDYQRKFNTQNHT